MNFGFEQFGYDVDESLTESVSHVIEQFSDLLEVDFTRPVIIHGVEVLVAHK